MKYNSDFKYDLSVGVVGEKLLGDILSDKKIEVKTDLKAKSTGNVYVDYFSRGKPSGIATSQADYYCFVLEDNLHLIPSQKLKDICREYIGTDRDKKGGDNNTSKGILLPLNRLI